jgi:hypothetical protein
MLACESVDVGVLYYANVAMGMGHTNRKKERTMAIAFCVDGGSPENRPCRLVRKPSAIR